MATGTISALLQDDDIMKENQTLDQSFVPHMEYASPRPFADGELIRHVTTAFAEVCKRIETLHNMIEKQAERPDVMEEKPDLDSMILQEKDEVGWLERIKQIIYGKDKEESTEYPQAAEEHTVQAEPEQIIEHSVEHSTLLNALRRVEKAGMQAVMSRQGIAGEITAQRERESATAEIAYQKARAEAAEQALKETKEQLASCRARLKIRKKEITEVRASFSSCSAAEASLAKLATTASVQITRILLLLGMPDAIEQLHKEISAGEVGKLVTSLQEIEGVFRESMHREKEMHEKMQKDKMQIGSQILALHKELDVLKRENQEMIKETEKMRDEKDAIINKQRLAIKLLKSRIVQGSGLLSRIDLPESISARKDVPINSVFPAEQAKPKSKVEIELRERIADLEKHLAGLDGTDTPQYKKSLADLEDCKRRLADFMKI
ncbi:hypothetical protein NEAUS04_1415 [Nematocida ausubeli]|nr:hypothetical protein NEAUS05_1586 [Nematocida ausubeli]KAI5163198.1 hypothetical protein NEAUS04_1415 [Nematocida ausubeli]